MTDDYNRWVIETAMEDYDKTNPERAINTFINLLNASGPAEKDERRRELRKAAKRGRGPLAETMRKLAT